MPSIITQGSRVLNANTFVSNNSSSLYMSIGKSDPWLGEPTIPQPQNDFDSLKKRFERMIAMKKLLSTDVTPAIKRYNWNSGDNTYVAYNSSTTDMHTMKFFTYADGHVFKCIKRGAGASTEMPTMGNSIITTPVGDLPDGYLWKYMYTIPAPKAEKFNTPGFIPVENKSSNVWENPLGNNPISSSGVSGHGVDNISELFGYYVIASCKFETDEGGLVNVSNSYREICLVDLPSGVEPVYDMTTKIQFNTPPTGTFIQNETVSINGKSAVVVEVGSGFIKVNSFDGSIIPSGSSEYSVIGSGASGTYVSGGVTSPSVEKYTGNILFAEQRMPITRAPDQVESLNIVLEF